MNANTKSRLNKLEERFVGDMIIIKVKGGGTAMLPSRDLYDTFLDVLEGRETPRTRIALAAESSNENGCLIELMQALAG